MNMDKSRHPGWLSCSEIALKACLEYPKGLIASYYSMDILKIDESEYQRYRLQKLSPMRLLNPKLSQIRLGLIFVTASLSENISRNVVYKLRGNERFSVDDVLISGCSTASAWHYFSNAPYMLLAASFIGLVQASIEAARSYSEQKFDKI